MKISDQINQWIETSVERHAHEGEGVRWDSWGGLDPKEGPFMGIAFYMKAMIINSYVQSIVVISPPVGYAEEEVDQTVRQILEGLRAQRAQQIESLPPPPSPFGNSRFTDPPVI